jgi:hypothetical protein
MVTALLAERVGPVGYVVGSGDDSVLAVMPRMAQAWACKPACSAETLGVSPRIV